MRSAILFCFLIFFSCQENPKMDSFKDLRDGKTYQTIEIDNKTWMTENLQFASDSSWCYNNQDSLCEKYGRLYTWNAANKACPNGWRLPTKEEWLEVSESIADEIWYEVDGGEQRLFQKMKPGGKSGVNLDFPGLYSPEFQKFAGVEEIGSFWSSTSFAFTAAVCAVMDKKNGESFILNPGTKSVGHSCRCIKE